MWVLKTPDGAESQFSFRILPGNIKTVGRATRADFVLDAGMVSRLHCRLSAGAAEMEVQDLESTNGTFVNGARVARATLKHGDRLGIGRVELMVVKGELTRETDSSASLDLSSSVLRDLNRPASRPES
jgi:pSer/pThr/pTyr-binding forkhead associated (FHA) protein